jgi:membrane-associated protease RseP (regulator of RpoE activity)
MNYLKSVFAGLAAVLLICGVIPTIVALVQILMAAARGMARGGFGIGFGPVRWHAPSLTQWLFVFAAFGIGFIWEFRRLAKRQLALTMPPVNPPIS